MKFAILAPGGIAHSMAKAVSEIDKIERYAVASRDLKRAESLPNSGDLRKLMAPMRRWRRTHRWNLSMWLPRIPITMSTPSCA